MFLNPKLFYHIASAVEVCALALVLKSQNPQNCKEMLSLNCIDSAEDSSIEERRNILTISPLMSLLRHSCCPNSQIEMEYKNGLRIALISLRNICKSEELTIAHIAINQSLVSRRTELFVRHKFICRCERCKFESRQTQDIYVRDLHSLSNQAYEEGRYYDSEFIVKELVRLDTESNGLHTLGVSLLSHGNWSQAHSSWKFGHHQFPENRILALQRNKEHLFSTPLEKFQRDKKKKWKYNMQLSCSCKKYMDF